MATHVFDVAAFREMFPAYADATKYPDALLQGYWAMATCYIEPEDWCGLNGECLQFALNLTVAHLCWLAGLIAAGNGAVGVQTSASVGSVSVSMQPPPIRDAWQAWLALSPYGMQLWALLDVQTSGGLFVGGSHERAGIRKAGGIF